VLEERTATLRVRSVIEMEGLAADRTLMPPFPGIAEAESSRDWEPSIPIDLGAIRDGDEAYWHEHRGTPKAFVTLGFGRREWGSRFGSLTAIRWSTADPGNFAARLRDALTAGKAGLTLLSTCAPRSRRARSARWTSAVSSSA
jgi:hypothetical protein